jgi:hypothetical protein
MQLGALYMPSSDRISRFRTNDAVGIAKVTDASQIPLCFRSLIAPFTFGYSATPIFPLSSEHRQRTSLCMFSLTFQERSRISKTLRVLICNGSNMGPKLTEPSRFAICVMQCCFKCTTLPKIYRVLALCERLAQS